MDDYILLTGRANPKLAWDIAKILGKDLVEPISSFSDGEIRVKDIPNLRRRHVFIIQPTSAPVNDNIIELLLMIDAAKRASATEVVAIIPYFGYSRQDRKELPRVPISAAVVAQLIEHSGADRIFAMDIHSEQAEGFVQIPWDNLYGSYTLLPELKKRLNTENLVVASPDKGGMTRATGYSRILGAKGGLAIVYKERDLSMNNQSKAVDMIGDVSGKDVLLVDDMIDTGGTIVQAADYLKQKGAKKIIVAATHGLFSGNAVQKIAASSLEEVIITDTIAQRKEVIDNPKISVVSIAPLLAEAIKRIKTGESISKGLIL